MIPFLKNWSKIEQTFFILVTTLFVVSGIFFLLLFFQTANSETPKSGGDYTEALIGTIESINPLYASTNPADLDISKLIFSGLTRFDLQQQRMVLDIADTIEVSEDRKTYTFTIQEDIQWHDEQPFSVDDILFTYRDVLQSPEYTGPYKGLWKNIVIEKIDNKTIRFQLNTPDIFFLRNTSIGILPKHILEYADINNLKFHKYSENPIGTGPYKIQRHLNNTVKLVRFEESYHEGNYLDSITLKVYDNYKDIINNQKSFNSIKQIPSEYLSTIDTSHFDIQEFTLPQYTALFFNTKNEYLKNPYLRNLFVEGLSKTDLLSDIEHIQEANSPVFINNESASSDIHIPAGETIRKYFERFGFRDIEETEVDTSLAHSPAQYLYKEVSFQGDLFEKKLLFQLACLNTQEHLSIAYKIKNTLEKWGVDIQVQEYSNKEIIDIITERDYDLLIFGQNLGTDLDLYPIWHSSQTEWAGQNIANFTSLQVDHILSAIRGNQDEQKHVEYLKELEQILLNEKPIWTLYTPIYYHISDNTLQGVQFNLIRTISDRLNNVSDWYINKKRVWK